MTVLKTMSAQVRNIFKIHISKKNTITKCRTLNCFNCVANKVDDVTVLKTLRVYSLNLRKYKKFDKIETTIILNHIWP
jgi:hypothetical protein